LHLYFKNIAKSAALFLLSVFLFALLAKPVHLIFEHHDFECITSFHSDEDLFVPDHHFNCDICEFEFCTFLSGDEITLPVADFHLLQINSDKEVNQSVLTSYFSTQLRAPPVA